MYQTRDTYSQGMPSPKFGTAIVPPSTTQVRLALVFNEAVFKQRTSNLGCRSDRERAKAAGISRTTLNRLRGGQVGISHARALAMAEALEVSVDDLFIKDAAA